MPLLKHAPQAREAGCSLPCGNVTHFQPKQEGHTGREGDAGRAVLRSWVREQLGNTDRAGFSEIQGLCRERTLRRISLSHMTACAPYPDPGTLPQQ